MSQAGSRCCAFALAEIGHRIEAESIDATVKPALHYLQHGLYYPRIVEVQVRLVGEKAVPVESVRFGIHVQFDFSLSVKMMRVPEYFWSVSLQTYQLRALVPAALRLARLNQWC